MELLAADRLDRMVWALTAAVAVGVALAALLGRFTVLWNTFLLPGSAFIALSAAAWFYRHHRFDLKLASALGGTAQIAAFAAFGAPLSYMAAIAAAGRVVRCRRPRIGLRLAGAPRLDEQPYRAPCRFL
jgi:hypothetical protein